MDLKGISWVGNFYHKFEAMCLEVEEIMYQDTVKYVENQVQTVGSSVKRFYSDVMQDLIPPSSMDAAKGADSDLPLDFYGDVGIYMKPKIGMKEKQAKVGDVKKFTENQKKTTNENSDYAPPFERLSHVDNLFPLAQEDFTGGALRKHNKESLSKKSNLRTRKNSKTESASLNEQSGAVTCSDKDMNRGSSFCEPSNENHLGNSTPGASRQSIEGCLSRKSNEISRIDTPFGQLSNENHNSFHQEAKIITTRLAGEMGTDLIEERQNETEIVSKQGADIPSDEPASDVVDLAEMDMRASSGGASLVEANATSICMNDGVISPVESCTNWQVLSDEIACGEDFLFDSARSDGWSTDVNEVDTSFVSDMEVIQQIDKPKLEESCIVVNRDDFRFVPCCEGKSKSYQKKIRDVFSPRKSSTRKHEYEQLALWPAGDSNPKKEECGSTSIPSLTMKDGKRSQTADICEAEWELL
ncbi:uncharacterized protein [Euphorbia lathyris]|uniref:uncharacterized protein n=1 Tax=Euphorbia lathyris TaxID=212925 RepID=UPI0033143A60